MRTIGLSPTAETKRFLSASVIEYHIQHFEGFKESQKKKLLESLYVDNVVTSVGSKNELEKFIANFEALMTKGGFVLR